MGWQTSIFLTVRTGEWQHPLMWKSLQGENTSRTTLTSCVRTCSTSGDMWLSCDTSTSGNSVCSTTSGVGSSTETTTWTMDKMRQNTVKIILNTDVPGSWKQSSKTFHKSLFTYNKAFCRNTLHNLKLHNLRIIMEYTSQKLNGCIISKTKSIKLPNR